MTSMIHWHSVKRLPKEGERYLVKVDGSEVTYVATFYERIYNQDVVWMSDSGVELNVRLWAEFPTTIDV